MSDAMEAASPGSGPGLGAGPGPPSTDTSPGPGTPADEGSSPAPPAPPLPPQPQHNGSPTDNTRLVQSGNITTISVGSPHSPSDKAGKIIKYYPPTCNGNIASDQEGRCSVLVGSSDRMPIVNDDDITGPDMEISNIHFKGVNMRCKKKLDANLSEDSHDDFVKEEQERPMSWEGELSDTEMSVVNGSGISLKHEHEDSSMEGVQVSVLHNTQISDSHSGNIHFGDSEERNHNQVNVVDSHGQSQEGTAITTASELPLLVDKLLSDGGCYNVTPSNSPVLSHRQLQHNINKHSNSSQSGSVPPNPSPDSAIHSAYSYSSPAQSPVTSRHGSHGLPSSGFSSPYTPTLSRNNSDASQYGGSQHSSCYSQSYSSVSVSPTQFSPTHSPIQSRHLPPGAAGRDLGSNGIGDDGFVDDRLASLAGDLVHHPGLSAPPGISRQQLINSPCPICGDKISGFHYGIFSCESCKGFFKRTVQNRKNYVCLRGSTCLVTIATRKKCPACRFEKCLRKGMKLEAIREDRTRGGRSTYQISYTLPPTMVVSGGGGDTGTSAANSSGSGSGASSNLSGSAPGELQVKVETPDLGGSGAGPSHGISWSSVPSTTHRLTVPPLLQEIMEVEHLWNCNDQETQQKHCPSSSGPSSSSSSSTLQSGSRVSNSSSRSNVGSSSSESSVGSSGSRSANGSSDSGPDFLNLCNIADHRLYKIVKWCKSLPLFKNISIDDQIILLLNAWCELLLFSCCFRSMSTPGEIRVSLGKAITLAQAKELGLGPCIERMLNLTEHLRRLRVDKFEYVAMKVIILLTSDASDLHESEKVRASQEKALQALQHYTLDHYPDIPSKFGELLLRIPDLQRTCQNIQAVISSKRLKITKIAPSNEVEALTEMFKIAGRKVDSLAVYENNLFVCETSQIARSDHTDHWLLFHFIESLRPYMCQHLHALLHSTEKVGKEMLSIKNKEGEGPSFMLLMELLRGDH